VVAIFLMSASLALGAQNPPDRFAEPRDPDNASSGRPEATLLRTPAITLTGEVDSNSPAVWELIDGEPRLVVLTSVAGRPSWASGSSLRALSPPAPVVISPWPGEGVWMEAIVRDDDGTWYGFYHNERTAVPCGSTTLVTPRVGAARSHDFGVSWINLGILLEAPSTTYDCDTLNKYFAGGVGDLSATVDRDHRYVYLFFSQYGATVANQGIAAARFLWADRDEPVGKTDIWSGGAWIPAGRIRRGSMAQLLSGIDQMRMRWALAAATPLFPTNNSWHGSDTAVDAFWGPSIHWNTHLERYVMLLNRAKDETFAQEGIDISFNRSLENPAGWSSPVRILDGGNWYPQVMGIDPGGTDTEAGQVARFFMRGRSDFLIRFDR
jgi:hypothetical protein